jgi:thiosulfate/3-mercaptopyruvate sulfurtransferase
VIFYGDKNNWWATYAYWVFQLFGHTNAKIMDGGRAKWWPKGARD